MAQWVKLCEAHESPKPGEVIEATTSGLTICLANVDGHLCALDNVCPHRGGPLGEGWLEGQAVVCPWHSWAFNTTTGITRPPEKSKVSVFPVKIEGEDVLVQLS